MCCPHIENEEFGFGDFLVARTTSDGPPLVPLDRAAVLPTILALVSIAQTRRHVRMTTVQHTHTQIRKVLGPKDRTTTFLLVSCVSVCSAHLSIHKGTCGSCNWDWSKGWEAGRLVWDTEKHHHIHGTRNAAHIKARGDIQRKGTEAGRTG